MFHKIRIYVALLALLAGLVIPGTVFARDKPVLLIAEGYTNLRVGKTAVLLVPSGTRYNYYADSRSRIDGDWKDVLDVVQHSKRKVVFRASHPGPGVLLLSPDVPNGECISCATVHYFINVIPIAAAQKNN